MYPDCTLIGKRGLVVQLHGTRKFIEVGPGLNKVLGCLLDTDQDLIFSHVANYSPFDFYIELIYDKSKFTLYYIAQQYRKMTILEEKILARLKCMDLRGTGRTIAWFKAIALTVGDKSMSDNELLSLFKLTVSELKILHPYITDWLVERASNDI
jgi:hypothetical protein